MPMKPEWKDIPTGHWTRARELRKQPTSSESKLWLALRSAQLGVSFRRQRPIGPYVVDFYAPVAHLVVEVDGDTHAGEMADEYDRSRDQYLAAHGLTVRRYSNMDVLNNLDGVVYDLKALVEVLMKTPRL